MALAAIRYVAAFSKSALGLIHLRCQVKPDASRERQGIIAVSDESIQICVAARAREGEANKASITVLSDVLGYPDPTSKS